MVKEKVSNEKGDEEVQYNSSRSNLIGSCQVR